MKKHITAGSGWTLGPSDELARAIRETREANGFNHDAFARHLKKDYVSVWRWEKGQRVPQQAALVAMLKMAPKKWQHVFERYTGKVLEQVLQEEFQEAQAHGPDLDPGWVKEPEKHVDGIYIALTERLNLLRMEAKMKYEGAAATLSEVLVSVMRKTQSPRRRR